MAKKKITLQNAVQMPLFAGPNQTICMICHKPGATIMHDMMLERQNYINGELVHVKAFGWIHEECENA